MSKKNLESMAKDIVVYESKVEAIKEMIVNKEQIISYYEELSKGKYFECLYLLELLEKDDLIYMNEYFKKQIIENTIHDYNIAFLHTCVLLNKYDDEYIDCIKRVNSLSSYNYFSYLLLGSKYNYALYAIFVLSHLRCFEKIIDKFIWKKLENIVSYDELLVQKIIDVFIKMKHLNACYNLIYVLTLNNGGINKKIFEKYVNMNIEDYIKLYYSYYYGFQCIRQLYNIYNLKDGISQLEYFRLIPNIFTELRIYNDSELDFELEEFYARELVLYYLMVSGEIEQVDDNEINEIINSDKYSFFIVMRIFNQAADAYLKRGKLKDFIKITEPVNQYLYIYLQDRIRKSKSKRNMLLEDFVELLINNSKNIEEILYMYLNSYYSITYNLFNFIICLSKHIDITKIFDKITLYGTIKLDIKSPYSYFYSTNVKNIPLLISNIYLYKAGLINENNDKPIFVELMINSYEIRSDKIIPNIKLLNLLKISDEKNGHMMIFDKKINDEVVLKNNMMRLTNDYFIKKKEAALKFLGEVHQHYEKNKYLNYLRTLYYCETLIDCYSNSTVDRITTYLSTIEKNNIFHSKFNINLYNYLRKFFSDDEEKQKIEKFISVILNSDLELNEILKIYDNSFLKYYYSIINLLFDFAFYREIREKINNINYKTIGQVVSVIDDNNYIISIVGLKKQRVYTNESLNANDYVEFIIYDYDRYDDIATISNIKVINN